MPTREYYSRISKHYENPKKYRFISKLLRILHSTLKEIKIIIHKQYPYKKVNKNCRNTLNYVSL